MNAIHARSQLRYWPTFGRKLTFNGSAAFLKGSNLRPGDVRSADGDLLFEKSFAVR
jgi:hypothetical protein